jgi:hypothetical protein
MHVGWPLHALDVVMFLINLVAVMYAIREYRQARPTYLVLWLSALFYGVILEFTTGMMISRSYIQGQFTVMLETGSIPGYKTDMPFYILLLYPAINFLGFKLIESFGIWSISQRAVAAGAFTLLIDAPYVINGPLPGVGWWKWLDWTINGHHIFQYWYGWPMADALWELTWPPLLMWLVWKWEERQADSPADIVATKKHWLPTLVGVPLVIGVLVNTGGLLLGFPLGIALALNLPHYPVILVIGLCAFGTLLFSTKSPVGLERTGWALLIIHVLGYGAVTVAQFTARPIPSGQIVIVLLALIVIVMLAAYPGHVLRDREPVSSPVA